jgi:DNA repair exonuclease SbcCD ATPase subunit
MEPRVAQLEPEVLKLRGEREQWMEERARLLHELNQLRPLDEALAKLTTELLDVKMFDEEAASPIPAQTREDVQSNTNNVRRKPPSKKIPTSRQHAAWIGIPCLRSLCPTLYDFIRKLSGDLIRCEAECEELTASVHVLKSDIAQAQQQHSINQQRLLHSNELSDAALSECRDRVLQLESELVRARNAKTVLEQLRVVLLSFPGGIDALFNTHSNFSSLNSSAAAASRRPSLGGDPIPESKEGESKSSSKTRTAYFEDEIKKVMSVDVCGMNHCIFDVYVFAVSPIDYYVDRHQIILYQI